MWEWSNQCCGQVSSGTPKVPTVTDAESFGGIGRALAPHVIPFGLSGQLTTERPLGSHSAAKHDWNWQSISDFGTRWRRFCGANGCSATSERSWSRRSTFPRRCVTWARPRTTRCGNVSPLPRAGIAAGFLVSSSRPVRTSRTLFLYGTQGIVRSRQRQGIHTW